MPSMISRMLSTPVWLAASISITSTLRSSLMARHEGQVPQGSAAGEVRPSS